METYPYSLKDDDRKARIVFVHVPYENKISDIVDMRQRINATVNQWIFINNLFRNEVDVLADKNWKLELNEYIRQGEPDKVDKSNAWKTAIGL